MKRIREAQIRQFAQFVAVAVAFAIGVVAVVVGAIKFNICSVQFTQVLLPQAPLAHSIHKTLEPEQRERERERDKPAQNYIGEQIEAQEKETKKWLKS